MSQVIWKYTLMPGESQLEFPSGATILSVQLQREVPVVWALVDPDEETREARTFVTCPTGERFDVESDKRMSFLGTVQRRGGTFVWHIFEIVAAYKAVTLPRGTEN
jgi:hypothetical protein